MERKASSAIRSTETVKEVSGLVKWWYAHMREVKEKGGHIAWVMFAAPQEVLLAMDVIPVGTEQYSSAVAAKQAGMPFCERAEAEGYTADICGYCRLGLGYASRYKELGNIPPEAPYGGQPKPDFCIGRTHCEPGYKWYQALQRYMNIPHYVYENLYVAPDSGYYIHDSHIARQYSNYYRGILKGLVAFLEEHTGKKLDLDRLRSIIKVSQETLRLWDEIFQMRKAVPSPMPTQDFMSCQFPIISMIGTGEALDFTRKLHAEVKHRVDNKIGVITDEKYRLLWGGVPPWHNMAIFNYFQERQAVCAIEFQYPPPEPIELDLTDPLEALVKRDVFTGAPIGNRRDFPRRGEESYGSMGGCYRPVSFTIKLAREYNIDGMVIHHIPSCRNAVIGHMHGERILRQQLDIPTLLLEGDMVDARFYEEARVKVEIETFLETVAAAKERRAHRV